MNILATYQNMARVPGGKQLFSRLATMKAPYFATIRPLVLELSPTKCVVSIPKRRQVLNHIGTVHAIAMCNACEFAFGLTMEAGLPSHLRWIPKGMTVRYLKKAETNLIATCDFSGTPRLTPGDHVIPVKITDKNKVVVMEADITVYVSART